MGIDRGRIICAAIGCGRTLPRDMRTWCDAHYHRIRKYGSPYGGPAPRSQRGLALAELLAWHIEHGTLTPEGCLFAVGNRKALRSYPNTKWKGRSVTIARLMVAETHGLDLADRSWFASHLCEAPGHRHRECINPLHLVPESPGKNTARAIQARRPAMAHAS